jgi:hypothetical protein
MHFDLKPISAQSIPDALARVERYRLLNEPSLAESICLDILAVDPSHQQALISLFLARTDQFSSNSNSNSNASAKASHEVLSEITGDYERAYYTGIFWERLGHARLRQTSQAAAAFHAFQEAMTHYELAASLNTSGNEDATLRWNTCARVIMQNPHIWPHEAPADPWSLEESDSRIPDA